jgi:NAD(P)H-hydrate epimerase
MQYILTPQEMHSTDEYGIQQLGIPSLLLMENASRSATEILVAILKKENLIPSKSSQATKFQQHGQPIAVTFLCGVGNNGGDGFAMARHLHVLQSQGEVPAIAISIIQVGDEASMSSETQTNQNICLQLGIEIIHLAKSANQQSLCAKFLQGNVIIDALLGTGGSEFPREYLLPLLEQANHSDALRISVDAPSGINSYTGKFHEQAFCAHHTITMEAWKRGIALPQVEHIVGKLHVAPIGLPKDVAAKYSHRFVLQDTDARRLLPERKRISSKFDYGKVIAIGGSVGMSGAIALTAQACLVAGAGMVKVFTPDIAPSMPPEVMTIQMQQHNDGTLHESTFELLLKEMSWADVIVIGPGLGANKKTSSMLRRLWQSIPVSTPIIFDADGLRSIAPEDILRPNIILTPHTGEFARLTKQERSSIEQNPEEQAEQWAEKWGCTVLLKYLPTFITDGTRTFWNLQGNSGMATAGSGDVLTGIIAGLVAQKIACMSTQDTVNSSQVFIEMTALAAYLHGTAGDTYSQQYAEQPLVTSNIITILPTVFHSLRL